MSAIVKIDPFVCEIFCKTKKGVKAGTQTNDKTKLYS